MTIREVFGLADNAERAPQRKIPLWWMIFSLVVAAGVERVVRLASADYAAAWGTFAFVVAAAVLIAPGWLLLSRLRSRSR